MGNISFPTITRGMTSDELGDALARVIKDIQYVVNGNISSTNVREIAGYRVGIDELKHKSGIVGMNGGDPLNPSAIRFWAGNADPALAPFRVQQDGTMFATNGNFTGTITGSTITGGTIRTAASGARIELSANNLTTYNSSNLAQGPCWGNTFGSNFGDMSFFDNGLETLLIKSLGGGSGYQISARSGANLNIGATGTPTFGLGDWDMQGTFKVHTGAAFDTVFQSNSAAGTLAALVIDFNILLSNLRLLNILA